MNRTEPYIRITLPGDDAFILNYNNEFSCTNASGAARIIKQWAAHGKVRVQFIGGNTYFTPESEPPIQTGGGTIRWI